MYGRVECIYWEAGMGFGHGLYGILQESERWVNGRYDRGVVTRVGVIGRWLGRVMGSVRGLGRLGRLGWWFISVWFMATSFEFLTCFIVFLHVLDQLNFRGFVSFPLRA